MFKKRIYKKKKAQNTIAKRRIVQLFIMAEKMALQVISLFLIDM